MPASALGGSVGHCVDAPVFFLAASCAFSSFTMIVLRSAFADFNAFFVLASSSFAAPLSPLYDLIFLRSAFWRSFNGFVRAISRSRATRRVSKSFMRRNVRRDQHIVTSQPLP